MPIASSDGSNCCWGNLVVPGRYRNRTPFHPRRPTGDRRCKVSLPYLRVRRRIWIFRPPVSQSCPIPKLIQVLIRYFNINEVKNRGNNENFVYGERKIEGGYIELLLGRSFLANLGKDLGVWVLALAASGKLPFSWRRGTNRSWDRCRKQGAYFPGISRRNRTCSCTLDNRPGRARRSPRSRS